MKKLALLIIAAGSLLSACVAYEVPQRDRDEHSRSRDRNRDGVPDRMDRDRDGVPDRVDRDRDGDGVSNRRDRRPDDPRRY